MNLSPILLKLLFRVFLCNQLVAQELAQERVRRKGSEVVDNESVDTKILVQAAKRPIAGQGLEIKTDERDPGYSLQSKSAEEKSQFIKARLGISKEVWCLFCGKTWKKCCKRSLSLSCIERKREKREKGEEGGR